MGDPGQGAALCHGDALARGRGAAGGHDLRRPADQARRQPVAPELARHVGRLDPGQHPRPLRPGPLAGAAHARAPDPARATGRRPRTVEVRPSGGAGRRARVSGRPLLVADAPTPGRGNEEGPSASEVVLLRGARPGGGARGGRPGLRARGPPRDRLHEGAQGAGPRQRLPRGGQGIGGRAGGFRRRPQAGGRTRPAAQGHGPPLRGRTRPDRDRRDGRPPAARRRRQGGGGRGPGRRTSGGNHQESRAAGTGTDIVPPLRPRFRPALDRRMRRRPRGRGRASGRAGGPAPTGGRASAGARRQRRPGDDGAGGLRVGAGIRARGLRLACRPEGVGGDGRGGHARFPDPGRPGLRHAGGLRLGRPAFAPAQVHPPRPAGEPHRRRGRPARPRHAFPRGMGRRARPTRRLFGGPAHDPAAARRDQRACVLPEVVSARHPAARRAEGRSGLSRGARDLRRPPRGRRATGAGGRRLGQDPARRLPARPRVPSGPRRTDRLWNAGSVGGRGLPASGWRGHGDPVRDRPEPLRRPVHQQRLVAGNARPGDQAHLGQRRAPLAEDRRGARRLHARPAQGQRPAQPVPVARQRRPNGADGQGDGG